MPGDSLQAEDWYRRAALDLHAARIALKGGAPAEPVAVLLQQIAEKYLKGYLLSKGWRLKKTHDLRELLDRAADHSPSIGKFFELASRLTALYIEERYPTAPTGELSEGEIASLLRQTEEFVDFIVKESGQDL